MNEIIIQWDKEPFTIYNPKFSVEEIQTQIKSLKPFRKGPYQINQVEIPSQWNSYIKWKYLKDVLERIFRDVSFLKKEIRLLDIGANNGYYSFLIYFEFQRRTISCDIDLIDPVRDFYDQFLFLKQFFSSEDQKHWNFHLLGWEDLERLPHQYDLILLMGILYHHTDMVELLRKVHKKLKTNGVLILETITISYGEFPLFLMPEKKYAGATGIWFLPNRMGVLTLLKRTNYRNIEFINERFLLEEMPGIGELPSLTDAISKENPEFTIEGYPKPCRSFFIAKR
ncbi:MAG: DUF1698 domain-containing protein [Leptospiraceae bacterium]|nr:DUF1698 domain-containing protein [Leptospiraceae bacterium]MDW7975117.1 DUF1698 domain-containing protein [Leptospiraceae bacterium]